MTEGIRVDESSGVSNQKEAMSRMRLGPVGYTGLKEVSGYIYEEAKLELRWPYAGETYRKMTMDPTIAAVTNFIKLMISKVEWKASRKRESSEEVKEATRFLSFCLSNMDEQTWREFISQASDYIPMGFQVNEKVYAKVKDGEWKGKIKISRIPSRPADTLTGWIFDEKTGKLKGVKQNPSISGINSEKGEIMIPRNKFLHFRNNPVSSNPEGTSALRGCFIPWKQKVLAEELELIGMNKDLAGVVNIGVDAEYLAKAAMNPAGPEAANINQLKMDAANLSAGEQTYVITPIAYTEGGKELFSFKLQGIDGGYRIATLY